MPEIQIYPAGSIPQSYVDPKLERYNQRLMRKKMKIRKLQKKLTLVMEGLAPRNVLPWWVRLVLFFR
jgi:uncharacterized membrane-anchored protein